MKKVLLLSGLLLAGVSGEVLAEITLAAADGCTRVGPNTLFCSKADQAKSSQTHKHSSASGSTHSPTQLSGVKVPSSPTASRDLGLGSEESDTHVDTDEEDDSISSNFGLGDEDSDYHEEDNEGGSESFIPPSPHINSRPTDRHRIYGRTPMPPAPDNFSSPTTESTVLNGNTDIDFDAPGEETSTIISGGNVEFDFGTPEAESSTILIGDTFVDFDAPGEETVTILNDGNVDFDFGTPEAESSPILTGDTSVDFGTSGADTIDTSSYDSGEDSSGNFDAPGGDTTFDTSFSNDSTVLGGDASVDFSTPDTSSSDSTVLGGDASVDLSAPQ